MSLSAAALVARYLRANDYRDTLTAFLNEAGLPPETGANATDGLTIEKILEEKKTYDLSVNFEKLGVGDEETGWRQPSPSTPTVVTTLPSNSNILHATVHQLALPETSSPTSVLLSSTADRRLNVIRPDSETFDVLRSYTHLQDAPILDCVVLDAHHILISSMSGRIKLFNLKSEAVLDERRDHTKYVVRLTSWQRAGEAYVASAGWDTKVFVYHIEVAEDQDLKIGKPIATLDLPSNPEALLFVEHPESSRPLLLLSRRDSTFIYYYSVPRPEDDSRKLVLIGKQNLAPHSNAWVAFTPAALAICPTDPSILAVATSAVPHMKLIIVRLLLPPFTDSSTVAGERSPESRLGLQEAHTTQASQARAALVVQDREEAAILVQCTTLSPQTQYSTPALVWRPDGSGVWVNSDDGVIRGIEASTGKVIVTLEGHEAGSKIRCLWAGKLRRPGADGQEKEEEWVVSGGFDRKLIVWKT
ncbi:WD40 repeat-like protein [Mytilinidion resinicola]|uniref:WD40 repeat-like protein n=1 Tax=Mytilinidion resinicola TaxID=574789 RepID=A0A6A6Z2N1_9PEZI|nr:WD40 repeat-like protein [Mytilinidion resinicola]KAF2815422.1 WD40 repeat-like protein [Mytilinidion resinicola]